MLAFATGVVVGVVATTLSQTEVPAARRPPTPRETRPPGRPRGGRARREAAPAPSEDGYPASLDSVPFR